jgi:cathepsin L
MDDGFEFVEQDGLCYESAYPYEGTDGTCKKSSCTSQVSVTGYTDIPKGDTDALKTACGTHGPISIAVDANVYWQMYTGGVFDHMCNPSKLDHGVLLVGYASDYWKVKNSWGSGWGENGYIRLTGPANTCGLANSASYPTVA